MHTSSVRAKLSESAAIFSILALLCIPLFFQTYRLMMFDTVPRDDYAPYLLHLIGKGGEPLEAPFGYRVISLALALPFYYVLPEIRFSALSAETPGPYLRATEALAFSSFLFLVLGIVVVIRIARDRFGCSLAQSMVAGLLGFSLYSSTSVIGVDPIAIFFVAAALYFIESRITFAAIILLSVFVNEKVFIVYVLLFFFRTLFGGISIKDFALQKVAVVLSACVYLLSVRLIGLPGNPEQLNPSSYGASFLNTAHWDMTAKGVMLNLLPSIIVIGLCVLLIFQTHGKERTPYWSACDLGVPLSLFVMAHTVNLGLNVGRVVMHCSPLFLPGIAKLLGAVNLATQRPSRQAP